MEDLTQSSGRKYRNFVGRIARIVSAIGLLETANIASADELSA